VSIGLGLALGPSLGGGLLPVQSRAGAALYLDGDSCVNAKGAVRFVAASSHGLTIDSNATLQTGDVDYWISCWVRLTAKDDTYVIATRDYVDSGVSKREFILRYQQGDDRFQFGMFRPTNSFVSVSATSSESPSTGTWYHVIGWHDAANDTVNISVNGTTDSAAAGDSAQDATDGVFTVGFRNNDVGAGANLDYMDGDLDQLAFGKPADIDATIAAIDAALYNSGSGAGYSDLTAQQKIDWGLVSFWEMDQRTGDILDSHGSNDLTRVNAPGPIDGKVESPADDGDTVSLWSDKSGNGNNVTQATPSSQPTLDADGRNASNAALVVDGTDDYLGIEDSSVFDFEHDDEFSLAGWFYLDLDNMNLSWALSKMLSSGTFRGYGLHIKGDLAASGKNTFQLWLRNNNTGSVMIAVTSDDDALTANTWLHLAATYDGSGAASGVTLYLNGSAVSMTASHDALGGNTIRNAIDWNLAGRDAGNAPFKGRMDGVMVASREWTAAQVADIYGNT
jgi:hypothetical protein